MTSEPPTDLNPCSIRHRHWAAISGIVASVILVAVVFWWWRPFRELPELQQPKRSEESQAKLLNRSDAEIVVRLKNSPEIRVKLTAVKPIITVKGPYRVSSLNQSEVVLLSGLELRNATISPSDSGTGINIGETALPEGLKAVELSPQDEGYLTVGSHTYRGRLRIYLNNDGGISLINVLPLALYIASVVDSEMPASFPVEARKAQAVVSRTYALVHVRDHKNRPYDVTDSTRHQRYLGYQYKDRTGRLLAGETPAGRAVTDITSGLVCQFDGEHFYTYYSADCGGETNRHASQLPATDLPVFKIVEDPFCEINPNHHWRAEIAVSSDAEQVLNGDRWSAMRKFALRSPRFEVVRGDNIFHVNGLGYGHGIGFCQWGANGRAQNGAKFDEILQAYFPGVEITKHDESPQNSSE